MEHVCSCNIKFINPSYLKRHLNLNPHHKQSVILENKPVIITNEEYSDDENINDREYQHLNSISWQQNRCFRFYYKRRSYGFRISLTTSLMDEVIQ